jgi:predicted Zn finger-like uncharacterized protein
MVIECSNCHARYNVDASKIPSGGVRVKCHKCQHIIVIQTQPSQPPPVSEPTIPEKPPTPDVQPSVTPPEPPPSVPETPSVPEPAQPSVPSEEPAQPEPAQPSVPSEEPAQPEQPEGPTEPSFPDAPSERSIPERPDAPDIEPSSPEPPETTPPELPDTGTPSGFAEPAVHAPEPEIAAPAEQQALPAVAMNEEDKKWNERARRLAKALASDLVLYNQDKVEEGLRNGTLANLLGPEIRRSWEYYCQQIPKHIVEKTDHFKDQLNKIVGKGKEIFK